MNEHKYTLKELIDFNNAYSRELESIILKGSFNPVDMMKLIQIRYFLSQIKMLDMSDMK